MYYAYDYDQKIMKQLHEERRTQLARTYADGEADTLALRIVVAKSIASVGDMLHRAGQALLASSARRQEQKLQVVRVHSNNSQ